MAGQGTMALELLEQVAAEGVSLDAIGVPVSGGGMISGIAVASKTLQPEGLAVVAAEPSSDERALLTRRAGAEEPQAGERAGHV